MTDRGASVQIDNLQERQWIADLQAGDEQALEAIFHHYYRYLVVTAHQLLHDDARAKDLVQDVFFALWEKRNKLQLVGPLKPYLRRAVVNKCIDDMRRHKRWTNTDRIEEWEQDALATPADQQLEHKELEQLVHRAVASLPERCQAVFSLSRFEELSHKEIASELNISVKTVENQITKALKWIRQVVRKEWQQLWWLLAYINW